MPVLKAILATHNPDKVEELRPILSRSVGELFSLLDYPDIPEAVENGSTFLENAMIKAKATYEQTGLPSLADDTGLEVDALGGEPGVFSSRYAGAKATYSENNVKLLAALKDVPSEKRTARFRCVAAFVDKDREHWVDGVCEGVILQALRGENGFGYDPVFLVKEKQKTLAEMTLDEKNAISHRAKAFRKMAEYLRNYPPKS